MSTRSVALDKSTNGRKRTGLWPRVFGLAERGAAGLGAVVAERLFFTTPRSRLSSRHAALLESGRPLAVSVEGAPLAAWSWGDGPAVLLVHGWGSRAAHFGDWIPALTGAGFSVVAFDSPAHGASPGRRTSIPEMAKAVDRVDDAVGRPAWAGLVAHSVGGPVASLALRQGLRVERMVFVAPGASPQEYTERFAQRLGIGPATLAAMKERAQRRIGWKFEDLDVPRMARGLQVPLLVLHDDGDEEVPWQDGERIARAWPGAKLGLTSGLGHRRILRDPGVIARGIAFVKEGHA